MNASHPLVFSPQTSFNDAISATDTKGAILIGLASTAISGFAYSIVTRLMAHRPDQDISYDKWLRNMILQTGFSKNLLVWLQGNDGLRKSHYQDNRKPIHLSRLFLPLSLKVILMAFTASLIILSIPRPVEFRSDQGVGIAAYLGGNGADLIAFEATLCKAFPKDLGRYTQLVDLQLCLAIPPSCETADFNDTKITFSIIKDPEIPFFIIGVSREERALSAMISLFMLTPVNNFKENELNIRNTTHENIAKVVRNGLRSNLECEMKDEAVGNITGGNLGIRHSTTWEIENCRRDLNLVLGVCSQAIAGSVYITTNSLDTVVHVHEDEIGTLNTTVIQYDGPIIMGTEPVLGVATLLALVGIAFVLDLTLSLIKPGESDYLSVIAPLVREVAGIDCLDNPLQAEKGRILKFSRVMRGKEGHLGYILKPNDVPVSDFPEGTIVRASAPSDLIDLELQAAEF